MRKVAAYIRVSTEEQAKYGYSIEGQQTIVRDFAPGQGLEIVREFAESHSAYVHGRPIFHEMVQFLKRHKDVTAVLVWKVDRLMRNHRDQAELTETLGVEIISATEFLPPGATGEFLVSIQTSVARLESAKTSERVSMGMDTKAMKGLWPTYAPTGYINKDKLIVPNSESAPLMRELLERFAPARMSVVDATQWAKERGLRSRKGHILARSSIHNILTNPIYYGAVPWKGKLHEGKHEALIDKATYDRNQEWLCQHARAPKTAKSFPYRGLMTCGYCGCKITAEKKKGKYVYYRCTFSRCKCGQPYHSEKTISDRFGLVIEQISISAEIADRIIELAQMDESGHRQRRERRSKELKAEIQKITALYDDACLSHLQGGMNDDQWVRIDRRFSRQLELAREEQRAHSAAPQASLEDIAAILELLKCAPELYMRQSDEERANLLETVVSNSTLTAENLIPVYRKPFDAVVEGKRSENWGGGRS